MTTASALATYSRSPTRAMPKGEVRPPRKTVFVSAVPSSSASRSRVMRSALGRSPDPARAITNPSIQPRRPPFFSFGLAGAWDSATSTSPLGRT
ncbi:hypothetical protein D3C73_991120 [compost metagenome]